MGVLDGKRVAVLATDGVEEVELTDPRAAVERAGATVEVVSIDTDPIQAMNSDIEPAGKHEVHRRAAEASADDYDALIMPGGTVNADRLRMDADVRSFVTAVLESGKPVAAICHAPWTLVEADLVAGRTLTSYPSLRTDIANAGGKVVDEEVAVDGNLITSRDPGDLAAFSATLVEAIAKS
ncbi:type 1 glutamine amidotransferase domain-containing protein [Pseudonocardia sp. CA-107938]|uniref:type 1 glutamine amidotransferase domain-containing protein n=1 Tax=Pseudonocardia sp. CA-107938 TaxID=3240021 RepID=UPI003D94A262